MVLLLHNQLPPLMLSEKVIPVILTAFVIGIAFVVRFRRRQPLPPGPAGYPVVGNLFDFPKGGKPWVTFGAWADRYGARHGSIQHTLIVLTLFFLFFTGPIFSATLLDKTFIFISDVDVSFELLNKRGLIYVDRPPSVMYELSGWSTAVINVSYGSR
jgi:hypothetical protein